MRVIAYYAPTNERSMIVGKAMAAGISAIEGSCALVPSLKYRGKPESEIAVFYGLASGLSRILRDYRESGRKAIYVDLGYWERKKRTRFDGYHKLVLNGRHPTEYFQARRHPADRFQRLGVKIAPWRESGKHIVVAGMSSKAAAVEGLRAQEWETRTINMLRSICKRPIVYRPKPNWTAARPIPGSIFQPKATTAEALRGAHAVVAHHSNFAVDAILAGIPAICPAGVASVMAGRDLAEIENPPMPEGREQWARDIAYCQWTIDEMRTGAAWRYLKAEVL